MIRRILFLMLWLGAALAARADLDPALVKGLASDDSETRLGAIQKLGQTASPEAARLLKAVADDNGFVTGKIVYFMEGEKAFNAVTGKEIDPAPDNGEGITINNRLRAELASALAALRLFDQERTVRLAAAKELQAGTGPELAPLLNKALAQEKEADVRKLLSLAYAQATLTSPDVAVRLAAVKALGEAADPAIRNLLAPRMEPANEADEAVRRAAGDSFRAIQSRLSLGENVARVFSGLSLGSILLLAALGLAITYGVMGVINMAHGEFLMIGAYAAYGMQTLFRKFAPGAVDWYVVAALPLAFISAAAVGMILERTVIRWLYGRPLETLLATWGLSLMLIQSVRTIFGPQNVEVANPVWMSGGIELLPGMMLPWNRIVIIGFAFSVLALVWALMNKTRLGMFVRAVTQNRAMAGCVGVPTGRIDTLAFGLGAGIAGLGGVALSQISNVGPDMGQGYIVDSFMVVVLGGVGQLAGAVWAALGLGVVAKFLEGWMGAVVAKIVVLVFIIVFIQKRPQGLFALKGRFVES